MQKIVVFTGAGVSAESGLGTFRDSDGLWEKYRIEDVCTHEAWLRNPQLCVDFYNARRRDVMNAKPNAAHEAIARLQQAIPGTRVITQNIDDLHERAGATNVVHLHGEIRKLRAENDELERRVAELRRKQNEFETNPEYVELTARRENRTKSGETVFDFGESSPDR